jgi:hypothetical protein
MNEMLKVNKNGFMVFTKVYIYNTNTKKPWNELTEKDKNKNEFSWYCEKWFFVSKRKINELDVIEHFKYCPELIGEDKDSWIFKKHKKPDGDWKNHAKWVRIYPSAPLTVYDFKLLLNVIGIRMLHFVR